MFISQGKLAIVDLTSGKIQITVAPRELVEKYLGGRGLNMYYLHKLLKPGIDPLSPENVLIFGAGLLTGSLAPNSSRINVSAKSPESGILGDANMGGFFGAEMKLAGFDRIIITGKASDPCYLYLADGQLEIRPADAYWGLNVNEFQKRLRADLGKDIQVACIGRAGERLVRMASIMSGVKNAAGRGGLGAVMGSKNLKGIVARGRQGLPVYNAESMLQQRMKLQEHILNSPILAELGRFGTPLFYEHSNRLGTIRTHNSLYNTYTDRLNAGEVERLNRKMLSCYSCVVHCRQRNVMGGEGPDFSALALLGANCGVGDPAQIIELNNMVNDFGLDASSVGTIIPWAIELYEREIIDGKLTGRELQFSKFGQFELVRDLLESIAERRGFGNILAESTRAIRFFGEEAGDYLIAVKGLPQTDPLDVRYNKSFALGLAVASRGGDHLRSRPILDMLELPQELTAQLYGQEIDPNPSSYRTKEIMVYNHENFYALVDSLGICKFICHGFNSSHVLNAVPHLLTAEHFCELTEAATGLKFTAGGLLEVGRRVINLERVINLREGITYKDDTLPKRYFEEEMPMGKSRGHRIERNKFEAMVARYYELRGWDSEGCPSDQSIAEIEELSGLNLIGPEQESPSSGKGGGQGV